MTVPRQISVLTPPIHPPSTSPGIFHQVIILLCASRALKLIQMPHFCPVSQKVQKQPLPPKPSSHWEWGRVPVNLWPSPRPSLEFLFFPFGSSCPLLRATSKSSSPQRSGTFQGTNYPLLICTFSFSHKCRNYRTVSELPD